GPDKGVHVLVPFDDGTGLRLAAGGNFAAVAGKPAAVTATWNGATWSPLGTGFTGSALDMFAFATFDDGTGPALYAGGRFRTADDVVANNVAKWDGRQWVPLGLGVWGQMSQFSPTACVFAVFDDGTGPALYAGGLFQYAGLIE